MLWTVVIIAFVFLIAISTAHWNLVEERALKERLAIMDNELNKYNIDKQYELPPMSEEVKKFLEEDKETKEELIGLSEFANEVMREGDIDELFEE